MLNNNRSKNNVFSLNSINNNKKGEIRQNDSSLKEIRILKKNLNFHNIKLFYSLNKKQNIQIKKKSIEDNIFLKIQKDYSSFSQNKHTLSKEKIKLEIHKEKIFPPTRNNDHIYITDLNYSNSINIKSPKEREAERNDDNKGINSPIPLHNLEGLYDISERSISIESPRIIKNVVNNNFRTLNNESNRLNTDNNIIIYNLKKRDSSRVNSIKLYKKYNHPYYDL